MKEPAFVEQAEALGHKLRRDSDGEVDFFALDVSDPENGYHNGPMCERCLEYWCHHCVNAGYTKIEPCDGEDE